MTLSWQSDKQTSNLLFGWLRCYWPWPYHSCVICVREFTHRLRGGEKSEAPASFFWCQQGQNRNFPRLAVIILLHSCLDKKLYEGKTINVGSGSPSKKQDYWIMWIMLLSKTWNPFKSGKWCDVTKGSSPASSLSENGPLGGHLA